MAWPPSKNMAYGIKNPPLAEWILNLGEAAEYMFDHTLFQDNLVFVDFCEAMVKDTNPSVLKKAKTTDAPNAAVHGYRTIAEIMEAFNPFEGEVYKEALQISRNTREMFCLMEGRHVHPSTVYPGGVGTMPTPTVFTDYLSRLLNVLTDEDETALAALGVAIAVANPELTREERGEVLAAMGLSVRNPDLAGLDGDVRVGSNDYSLAYFAEFDALLFSIAPV